MSASTPADIIEYPNCYVIIVDTPGVKSDQIDVQVEGDNMLVVSGERKREKEECQKDGGKNLMTDRWVGKFQKKLLLHENANLEKISAVCQDGVVTVTVEKKPSEPKKGKTIKVQVA